LIFWFANAPSLSTTIRASPFAAQVATFRLADCTVSVTSGVCPFFEMLPATDCVEMPPRKSPGFVLHCVATSAITDPACAICLTVLGFVCAACSWTLPLDEYGWPR
jgi:hypothetical protein